jgi:hypothetical protein
VWVGWEWDVGLIPDATLECAGPRVSLTPSFSE